jgi:hypothetical protein
MTPLPSATPTNGQPPALSLRERPDILHQQSDGLGALSGASIGVAAWFEGKPFRGYGLRLYLTNYGVTYETKDDQGDIDSASYVERRLALFFTSFNRFGPFTIGTGIGLGLELDNTTRCIGSGPGTNEFRALDRAFGDCDNRDILVSLRRDGTDAVNVNTAEFNSVDIATRLSLGVTID